MLQAIGSDDFSFRIPEENLRGQERELAEEMNDVMTGFRRKLLELERKYGKYETFLDTINIAIIVTGKNGDIKFMNRKAIEGLCGFRINRLSDLATLDARLPQALLDLQPGDSKAIALSRNDSESQIKISMVKYSTCDEESYIYSIEDINRLLFENEIESQRKLVSVITHEIMNSLSPIISLSNSLCELKDCSEEDRLLALNTIRQRSEGLLTFVENYRKLSQVGVPQLQWICIGELFEGLRRLLPQPYIKFDIRDPEMHLHLDGHQIEQVLLNLIKNAIEACGENPEIVVSARPDHCRRIYIISVRDNGSGIKPEDVQRIFVPFFTTKESGLGIGLSLSRRIVNSHNGSLRVQSTPEGSDFIIQLPLVYRL
ncbi:MAG: GHKL domain-containing protein [Muribaculaceae bacterium]|nr:GHKL domain-containing protein [Muribaculaceae bacterium]